MIIVTSIAPNHNNSQIQIKAINSWKVFGKIYSLNIGDEINGIEGCEDVNFIETHRISVWSNKPLVNIGAMIDTAIDKDDDCLLINSDIIISHLPEFKNDGITIFSRFDYTNTYENAQVYIHGFDAFYMPKQFLKMFPANIYSMGNVWWDYAIPYRAMENNIPVYWADGKFILHQVHPFQWDFEEWVFMAEFFKLEFRIEKHISLEQMSINILSEIKRRAIKIQ